jgi:hypothetical protein
MNALPQELQYERTEFESLGFFIEYLIDGKLIGCRNVDTNDRGCVGYESKQNHTAEETLVFKANKKIKKGTNYQTRIYPLCGKVITKTKNNKIMKTQIIKNAPDYSIDEKGTVTSIKTGSEIKSQLGSVRLSVNGARKAFKVSNLVEEYFGRNAEQNEVEEVVTVEEVEEVVTVKEVKKEKVKEVKKEKVKEVKKEKVKKEKVLALSRSQEIYILFNQGNDFKAIALQNPTWSKGHIRNAIATAKQDAKVVEKAFLLKKQIKEANNAKN